MGVIVAVTVGLILWLVLWALGAKGFDAFLITVAIALVATAVKMVTPYLPGNREG
jgi:nitrogen fixation-related uncharacterized protein